MTDRQDDSGALRERLQGVSDAMGRLVESDYCSQWMPGYIANWKRKIEESIAALSPQGSEPDGAQGGEAVERVRRSIEDKLADCKALDGAAWADLTNYVNAQFRTLSRPAIAPQATPAAVDDAPEWWRWITAGVADAFIGEFNRRNRDEPHRLFPDDCEVVILAMQAALAAPPAGVKP